MPENRIDEAEGRQRCGGRAMKHCKTCKWWTRKYRRGKLFPCDNESKLGESDTVDAKHDDVLLYGYDEGGRIYTGPEFGCVHHEDGTHSRKPTFSQVGK
jgi:hypothetical protein